MKKGRAGVVRRISKLICYRKIHDITMKALDDFDFFAKFFAGKL